MRSKMTINDIPDKTLESLRRTRNERGLTMSDLEIYRFAVEWENICNLLNKKRSAKLC